jgi:hypothetical protein
MNREVHVRFCEKLKGKILWLTRSPTARSDERMSLQSAIAEPSSLRGAIATCQSSGLNNTLQQQGKPCPPNNPRFLSWRTNATGQSTPALRMI